MEKRIRRVILTFNSAPSEAGYSERWAADPVMLDSTIRATERLRREEAAE
jgi:hypothetical protein